MKKRTTDTKTTEDDRATGQTTSEQDSFLAALKPLFFSEEKFLLQSSDLPLLEKIYKQTDVITAPEFQILKEFFIEKPDQKRFDKMLDATKRYSITPEGLNGSVLACFVLARLYEDGYPPFLKTDIADALHYYKIICEIPAPVPEIVLFVACREFSLKALERLALGRNGATLFLIDFYTKAGNFDKAQEWSDKMRDYESKDARALLDNWSRVNYYLLKRGDSRILNANVPDAVDDYCTYLYIHLNDKQAQKIAVKTLCSQSEVIKQNTDIAVQLVARLITLNRDTRFDQTLFLNLLDAFGLRWLFSTEPLKPKPVGAVQAFFSSFRKLLAEELDLPDQRALIYCKISYSEPMEYTKLRVAYEANLTKDQQQNAEVDLLLTAAQEQNDMALPPFLREEKVFQERIAALQVLKANRHREPNIKSISTSFNTQPPK